MQEVVIAGKPTEWLMGIPGTFARGQTHFIVGRPGSGKTTCIGHVADMLSRGRGEV